MKNLLHFFAAFLTITSAFAQAPDSALVEQPDQRTYFSKTYFNPRNNTYKTAISAGYVHYLASDGTLKDIDTNLRLDKSGAYYIIDAGLYNVAFAGDIGKGAYDVAYEVPRPVQPKFFDPGKPPAPITRIRWKILSYGYFDRQRSTYQILQNTNLTTPVVSGNTIDYPQIFNNIAVRYTCGNASLKEEIVLSQSARNTLPDPAKFILTRANTYFVVAMEFLLTPNNINAFARRQAGKTPIKQGNDFNFDGDEPIEFEDEHTTLQFLFPKDYAHAVADSVTGFANRLSIKRIFYSQGGKNYMLVGVPWNWLNSSPQGDLIIDPTTNAATNEDVRLYDAGNYGSDTKLAVGKFPNAGQWKSRSIISFSLAGIPSNATVLNAQMKLKYYEKYNNVTGVWVDRWIQAHQMLVGWDEAQADSLKRLTGFNWAAPRGKIGGTNPDANGSYESSLLFVEDEALPVWKSWDLTALTQKWVSGATANYGVILWATNENTSGYVLRFYSSEATNTSDRPYLEVIWSQLPRTVYFLKDHLGSIRASVQDTVTAPVVGYDDYDPWGYILAGRSMIASGWGSQAGIVKNKFTGKEYDDDYGLNWVWIVRRSYDSAIGRWVVMEPLAEKSPGVSPYVYSFNNPILFFDPNGEFPFTVHIRSFAPFNWFGGGLWRGEGTNRPFSTSDQYSSRMRQVTSYETETMIARNQAFGNWSHSRYGATAFSDAAISPLQSVGSSINTHLVGDNDAVIPGLDWGGPTHDIDVHTGLSFSIGEGDKGNQTLSITGSLSGDAFPSAEAFVRDSAGNSIFLGVSPAAYGPNYGPFIALAGDNKRPMISVNISIVIDNKGVFLGVMKNGKMLSIEEWNKQFESQSTTTK